MISTVSQPPSLPLWKAYLGLCKLRVVGAIVFTAIIGMFLYSLYAALQGFSGRDFRYPIVGVAADPL